MDRHVMNAPIQLSKPARQAPVVSPPLSDVDRPVGRQVLALLWPVLLQQWLIVAVNFSDRLLGGWTGHTINRDASAARTSSKRWR